MSGIAGLWRLSGEPVESPILGGVAVSLARRGQEGVATWHQGSVGMASALCRTTPESEHVVLPLVSTRGDLVLTADARLDNRAELIDLLQLTDRPAHLIPDGQLILAAYQRWGYDCPLMLLGDFAFAIWDERKHSLFCARDPMGIRPFYYHHTPRKRFVFGSDASTVLSIPQVPRQVNELRIAYHLAHHFEDESITFYSGIFRLPGAHRLVVTDAGLNLSRYWEPDLSRGLKFRRDEDYAEGLREVFTRAVRCRLRSNAPVGSMLSGGLDSSSIACVSRDILARGGGQKLHTFSAIFPDVASVDARIDERGFMQAVLDTGGFEAHWVRADQLQPLLDLLWQGDEAIPAPNLYMDEAIFRAARREGVGVILSGFDGDSAVSHGFEYLSELARTGHWHTLLREATATARTYNVASNSLLWHFGIRPNLPPPIVNAYRRVRRRQPPPVLTPDAPLSSTLVEREQLCERMQASESTYTADARKEHWQGLSSGLLRYAIELLDSVSAPLGVEVRYPFFDLRVVEFCLAIPASQKLRQGVTRSVMRRAMADVLPQAVRGRISKSNLSANFRTRLLEHRQSTIERAACQPTPLLARYVDIPAFHAAYKRYSSQPQSPQTDDDAIAVFLATVLSLWLDCHEDRLEASVDPGRQ
jgi:asparagine synthase (glutamine-hydrolysing)